MNRRQVEYEITKLQAKMEALQNYLNVDLEWHDIEGPPIQISNRGWVAVKRKTQVKRKSTKVPYNFGYE